MLKVSSRERFAQVLIENYNMYVVINQRGEHSHDSDVVVFWSPNQSDWFCSALASNQLVISTPVHKILDACVTDDGFCCPSFSYLKLHNRTGRQNCFYRRITLRQGHRMWNTQPNQINGEAIIYLLTHLKSSVNEQTIWNRRFLLRIRKKL